MAEIVTVTGSVDPPSDGASVEAAAPTASSWGTAGFDNELIDSCWDVVSGRADSISDISDFLMEIDKDPNFRSAANLQSLSRLRDALRKVPETASLDEPVTLYLQDAILISRQLLQRLR